MRLSPVLLFSFLAVVLFSSVLSARVGDSRSELESRLKQSGRGMDIADGDLVEYHIGRSPIGPILEFMPETEMEVYYKLNTSVIPTSRNLWHHDGNDRRTDRPIQKPEGWLLHVVYLKGTSVLEYYQRSQTLTEFERNGILSLNQGSSEWREGRVPKENEEAIQPKVFRQSHYRADLAVYADIGGDTILLFDPRLDQMVDQRRTRKALELAPESLDGF